VSVWLVAPVDEEPGITLVRWHVFMLPDGSRHFCGYDARGHEGRVSTAVETFDPDSMTGRTASGRVYALSGPSGRDEDALYVRGRWLALNGYDFPVVAVDPLGPPGPGNAAP